MLSLGYMIGPLAYRYLLGRSRFPLETPPALAPASPLPQCLSPLPSRW